MRSRVFTSSVLPTPPERPRTPSSAAGLLLMRRNMLGTTLSFLPIASSSAREAAGASAPVGTAKRDIGLSPSPYRGPPSRYVHPVPIWDNRRNSHFIIAEAATIGPPD